MIEKIERIDAHLVDKINQLIDAINKHEDIIRQIGEWGSSKGECLWCENLTRVDLDDRMLGCTTLEIPESYKADPYEKQRRWIGKLCRFWDSVYDRYYFDTLKGITDEGLFIGHNGAWKHCEPVKPDSELIYHGE